LLYNRDIFTVTGKERALKPLDIDMRQAQETQADGAAANQPHAPEPKAKVRAAVVPRRPSRLWIVPQIILPIIVIAAAIYGANMLIANKPEIPQRPTREQVYIVETQPVRFDAHRPVLRVFGTLVAGRSVELRALVGGEVVSVMPGLTAGAKVEKGDVLVEIDRFEYEGAVTEARINLAEARAALAEGRARLALEEEAIARYQEQLDFAEKDLERAERLVKTGNITQRGVDERRLIVSQRGQALEQRRNTITIEKARVDQQAASIQRLEWRLSQAQRNLANTKLIAPFTGVVTAENAEIGRLMNVNDLAVSMYETGHLEARFVLSDRQYGDLALDSEGFTGREVEVVWHVGGEPVRFKGKIDRVAAEIAAERGGIEVYASVVPETTRVELRPGAFVEINVPGRAFNNTIRLPETAVYGGENVFVVEDGRLVRRAVEVHAYDDGDVIISGDLAENDRVLLTRIAEVGDGLKVREPGAAKAKPEGGGRQKRGEKTAQQREAAQ